MKKKILVAIGVGCLVAFVDGCGVFKSFSGSVSVGTNGTTIDLGTTLASGQLVEGAPAATLEPKHKSAAIKAGVAK